jgi:cytidine deaminase
MTNEELIERAASVINARPNGDFTIGDVGCALVAESGAVYVGVCIDAPSGMGFCAEHNAIGAMVTAGESRIAKIVAVYQQDAGAYVLSPCGRCRQFIYQTDKRNLATEVVLAPNRSVSLGELLPYHDWFEPLA